MNQVGGNDSLVFDGSSLVLNREGNVIAQARSFEEDLIYFDSQALTGEMHEQTPGDEASAYSALVLGTRDYIQKCGFRKAIVGLSGGIDSALTAVIAADAVGAENVIGVGMPGPYSSQGSLTMRGTWQKISGSVLNYSRSTPPTKLIGKFCAMFFRDAPKM